MQNRQPYTFDRVVRMVITIAVILAVLWLLNELKGVLLPFFVACLIAYLLEPFVQFNRKLLHLKGRIIAVFVTLFEAVFFLGAICYFVMPLIFGEMHQMAVMLRNYATTDMSISFLPDAFQDYLRRTVDFKGLSDMLTDQEWASVIENALSASWNIITGSFSILMGIFSWFIVVLYVVFVMLDYERLGRSFRHLVPPKFRTVVFRLGNDVKESMNHYFRGQALVAAIVGVLFAIGFCIIGLPMAIVLGLFIGVLNLVPYLQLISVVPTGLLCLVYAVSGGGDFWSICWQCVAVYAVVQVIQDFYLVPRIMGKAMGLKPAIILLSLSIWGTLFGLIGLIIALPATTLLLSYYDHYVIGNDADHATANESSAGQAPSDSVEH